MKLLIYLTIFSTLLYSVTLNDLQKIGSSAELQKKLENMKSESNYKAEIHDVPVENRIIKIAPVPKTISQADEKLKKNIFSYKSDSSIVEERNDGHLKLEQTEIFRYGDSFFQNRNLQRTNSLSIPNEYQINIGDIISIWLYGARNSNQELEVDRNGNINIGGVGPLYIYSMEFKTLKEILISKYEALYKNTKIHVDIIKTTPIQVVITGEVESPGIYNIPALSTIKEALISANGISNLGSYRDIKLYRSGKLIKRFDIYKFIQKGETSYLNFNLKNGDTIFVPKVKKRVVLDGKVNRKGIYQLKSSENLHSLLSYAQGISFSGSNRKAKLKRFDKNEKQIVIDLDPRKEFPLQDGDRVTIYPINSKSDSIYIYGNVVHAGERGFYKGLTLYDFFYKEIKLNGLENVFLENVEMNYSVIKRYNYLTYSDEILQFSLAEVLAGKESLELKRGDEIYIFNRAELKENPYIYIRGSVITTPGKYQYFDNITLGDISNFVKFKSEDFIDGNRVFLKVSKEVKLLRNIREKLKIHFLDLDKNSSFQIQPLDEIVFFDQLEREKPKLASIKGEVLSGGNFRIDESTDINKLIQLAKGLTKKAYLEKFEVVRYRIEDGERKYEILRESLKEAMEQNFKILEFDEVTIFKVPKWNDMKSVQIYGEVKFPGNYSIEAGDTFQDVVNRAGGYLDTAFFRGAVFTRESIKSLQKKRLEESIQKLKKDSIYLLSSPSSFGENSSDKEMLLKMIDSLIADLRDFTPNGRVSVNILEKDFLLEDGDRIYIPTINETVSVIGEVLNPSTFFYREGEDVEFYLEKSGGLNHKADIDNIYIVHPNGEAERYESGFLFGFGLEIETGDTIVVPFKVETSSFSFIAKDVTQILYQLAITAVSLKTVGVF